MKQRGIYVWQLALASVIILGSLAVGVYVAEPPHGVHVYEAPCK